VPTSAWLRILLGARRSRRRRRFGTNGSSVTAVVATTGLLGPVSRLAPGHAAERAELLVLDDVFQSTSRTQHGRSPAAGRHPVGTTSGWHALVVARTLRSDSPTGGSSCSPMIVFGW
jgi:hypothetical protein